MTLRFQCANQNCGAWAEKPTGAVNRARAAGLNLYCDRACSGVGRRKGKTAEQRRAEKAAYDAEYRARNAARIKADKAEYFRRTYDPEKAAIERQARMPRHVEYCRRPEYRKWKREYDMRFRDTKNYGAFAESARLLRDLEAECLSRMSRYEIYQANGLLNKAKQRRKDHV